MEEALSPKLPGGGLAFPPAPLAVLAVCGPQEPEGLSSLDVTQVQEPLPSTIHF